MDGNAYFVTGLQEGHLFAALLLHPARLNACTEVGRTKRQGGGGQAVRRLLICRKSGPKAAL